MEAQVGDEGQQHEEDEDGLQQHEASLDDQGVLCKHNRPDVRETPPSKRQRSGGGAPGQVSRPALR